MEGDNNNKTNDAPALNSAEMYPQQPVVNFINTEYAVSMYYQYISNYFINVLMANPLLQQALNEPLPVPSTLNIPPVAENNNIVTQRCEVGPLSSSSAYSSSSSYGENTYSGNASIRSSMSSRNSTGSLKKHARNSMKRLKTTPGSKNEQKKNNLKDKNIKERMALIAKIVYERTKNGVIDVTYGTSSTERWLNGLLVSNADDFTNRILYSNVIM